MRILILALGSWGDVQPCVVLGKGLYAAGHTVRVATFENFATMVTAHSLEYHPIRGDAEVLLRSAGGQALAASGRDIVRTMIGVMRSFGAQAAGYARDLSSPALWDTDAIVNQLPGALYGYDLAEKLGVPIFAAAVMPLTRTRAFPMLAFPSRLAPIPGYNALSYRIAEQMVWQAFRPTINRWRQKTLGLPKAPFGGVFGQMHERGMPILNGFSAQVVPRPLDWGAHVHITGYWFAEDAHWQPPDDLRAFLAAGSPPVFVGFGSMPIRDPKRATALVLEALRWSGQRAILHAGWGGLGDEVLPSHVFKMSYAPYDWLFPQMAAVVHHGGSGTTACGARAGVPSVIVPFVFDQLYWGERLSALGVAPRPIPFQQLSAERLAEAIGVAVHDRNMRQKAAALGAAIRAEDGVGEVVKLVHRYTQ